MTTFSESELFRILENANAKDFPPRELRHILHAEDVKEKLLKLATYYEKKPTSTSLANLKSTSLKNKSEKELKIVEAIASTLHLDHTLAYEVHKESLLSDEQSVQQLKHSDEYYTSLDPIIFTRDFYLQQRQYLWKIVQEIIRISLDNQHVYHDIAAEYIEMLCERGLIDNLIEALQGLYGWRPDLIDETFFSEIDQSSFRNFCFRNDDKWAESVIVESELALDTLILLLYESSHLGIESFFKTLSLAIENQFNVPLIPLQHLESRIGMTSMSHLSSQNSSKRVHLKWIVFVVSVLQFYRLTASPSTASKNHPFFENIDDTLLNISSELKKLSDPVGIVIQFIWFLFLELFDPIDYERASRNHVLEKSLENGALETFTILCQNVLPSPSYNDIDAVDRFDTEYHTYYFILQDCINAVVSKFCNISTEFRFIDLISQVVDLVYRGDAVLCNNFWYYWSIAESVSYPLCGLMRELCVETWMEPLYFVRMLNSVSCFSSDTIEDVVLLLLKPVPFISKVDACQISIFEKESGKYLPWEEWFHSHDSSNNYKYQSSVARAKRRNWNSLRVMLHKQISLQYDESDVSLLSSPSVGCCGTVKIVSPFPEDINKENFQSVSLHVEWDSKTEWFRSLISILNDAATGIDFNKCDRDALFRVISTQTLFAKLLSQVPFHQLNEVWVEVCVKSFFRRHAVEDAERCHFLLRKLVTEKNEDELNLNSIQFIKNNQQAIYEQFVRDGINEKGAYELAVKFSSLYCPDLLDLTSSLAVNLTMSLTRCKVAAPTSTASRLESVVSLDHAIWLSLLEKTLYLMKSTIQTSRSPTIALHVLSKLGRHFDLNGPNSWSAVLFRMASLSEGVVGRYDVTSCMNSLLRTFCFKFLDPAPPDCKDLYTLFCRLDNDGSGGIDREELRQGLNNYGYTITASAINTVFQKIDEDNSGSVEFAELLQYANRTTFQDVENSHEDLNSDLFKAEKMLLALLKDLTFPGGGAGVKMAESVACATVDHCISCLTHLDKWKHTNNLAGRWSLTLNCVTTLCEIMSDSYPNGLARPAVSRSCWAYFMQKYVSERSLQSSLMQLCLFQGLTALKSSYASSYRDIPRSFREVLNSSSHTARDLTASDTIPINFSRGYYEVADTFEKHLAEKVSLKVLHIYSLLVDSYIVETNRLAIMPKDKIKPNDSSNIVLDGFHQFIVHLFSSASCFINLPFRSCDTGYAPSMSSNLSEFPCSYFAVLFAFVDFPKKVSAKIPRTRSQLPRAVLQFVAKVLGAIKAFNARHISMSPHAMSMGSESFSFLSGAGISNMAPLCESLCTSLLYESHLGAEILNFLVYLCAFEPLSLVQMLNVGCPDDGSNKEKRKGIIEPKDSYLVQTIEKLLTSAAVVSHVKDGLDSDSSDSNITNPNQLFRVLQLVLTMMDHSEHKPIGNALLYLGRKKSFWDCITLPLMLNVPDIDPSFGKTSNSDVIYTDNSTVQHSLRLLCHAASLRILARAKFGLLFFLDERNSSHDRIYESAETADQILNKFFDDKSRQNRFLSWIDFYTRVDLNICLHDEVRALARKVGINISDMISVPPESIYQPYYCKLQVDRFGKHYLFDTSVISKMKRYALDLATEDSSYKQVFQGKNAAEDWDSLLHVSEVANVMWTVADTQTDLLRSWKEFTESYIKIPPNRPINYDRTNPKKQRDAIFERSDSISTPRGDASPSSMKKSGFKFDRRSYELASEIIRQLAGSKHESAGKQGKPRGGKASEGEIAHYLGADVAVVKCDLLVSMLHYQLRDVTHRDADPSSSQISHRDAVRFDKKKMEGLLMSIEAAFQRLTEGLYIRPPSYTQIREFLNSIEYWKEYKSKIMLRLLTSKLMLFQALYQGQQAQHIPNIQGLSSDEGSLSIENVVCLQAFGNIRSALSYALNDGVPFSTAHSGQLSLSENLILTSLRLLSYVSPKCGSLSVENSVQWRDALSSSEMGATLVGILRKVGSSNVSFVNEQHTYSNWSERWNSRLSGGVLEIELSGQGDAAQSSKKLRKEALRGAAISSSDVLWNTLNSTLDAILAEGLYDKSLLFHALLEGDLLVELCQSTVFLNLQRVLSKDNYRLSAQQLSAYMAYDARTGEPSSLVTAWCKVIQIVRCSLRAASDLGKLNTQVQVFMRTYAPLLLLPIPHAVSNQHSEFSEFFSLQQMRLSNAVMSLYSDCMKYFATWKVLEPDLYMSVLNKALAATSSLSVILGDNDKHECNQKMLSQTLIVISEAEHSEARERQPELSKRERESLDLTPSRSGVWSTPPRGGSPDTPRTGSSFGGSHGGRSTVASCSKASRNRDRLHSLSNFFIDAVWAMFAFANPLLSFLRGSVDLREICGEEYEVDYGKGFLRIRHDHCDLPVGSQIYYLSGRCTGPQSFAKGVIIKVHHAKRTYDIQATSGLVDIDIPCREVAFSIKPVIPFAPVSSLHRDVVSESRYGASSAAQMINTPPVEDGSGCPTSTAYLMRILSCVRKWSRKWTDIEVVEHEKSLSMNMYVDLSILCGQLVWLLVVNIAHHSCCATEDLHALMGEQLDEIRDLIRRNENEIESEGRADAFLNDPSDCWDAIREWFERMYQRIMYRPDVNEWASNVDKTIKLENLRHSNFMHSDSSISTPKTGGTGSLRGGAEFK